MAQKTFANNLVSDYNITFLRKLDIVCFLARHICKLPLEKEFAILEKVHTKARNVHPKP